MPSSSPCLLFDQTLVSSLHGLHGYGLRASGGLMGPWGRVGLPAAGSVLCQFCGTCVGLSATLDQREVWSAVKTSCVCLWCERCEICRSVALSLCGLWHDTARSFRVPSPSRLGYVQGRKKQERQTSRRRRRHCDKVLRYPPNPQPTLLSSSRRRSAGLGYGR